MLQVLRSAGAVLLAAVAGGALIALVEAAGHALFAPHAGPPGGDSAATGYPAGVYVVVVFAWAIGTAAGVHLVARLSAAKPRAHAGVVACLFMALAILNLLSLPHPTWMLPAAVVALGLGGFAGLRTAPVRAAGSA